MKLARDIAGTELARRLRRYGYRVTRQVGSHMRLTTEQNGVHHVTIPAHRSLRAGTLGFVLTSIAAHLGLERRQLAKVLLAAAD